MDYHPFRVRACESPPHVPHPRRVLVFCATATALICLGSAPLAPDTIHVVGSQNSNAPHREAACLLVVHRGAENPWPDEATLTALLQTSGVADAPARDVLGMNPEFRAQKVHFQVNSGRQDRTGDLTLNLRIIFDFPQEAGENPGRAYLAAVLDRFRDALGDLRTDRSSRLEGELHATSDALASAERELAKVQEARKALDEKIGLQIAGPAELRAEPASVRGQIIGIMPALESYRLMADHAAVSVQDEAQHRAEEAWRKVVELRETKLPELQRLAAEGKVDPLELAEFEARLEEARARVTAPGATAVLPGISGRPGFPGAALDSCAPLKMARENVEELERLLDRLQRLEKLDLRDLASKMEELDQEQHRLGERRDALAAQIEKTRLDLKNLSLLSVVVIGK